MSSFIKTVVDANPALLVTVGALLTSLILQGVKKLLSVANEKVITILHVAVGMVIAATQYLIQTNPHTPWVIALNGFILMGASSPLYRFVVKPSYQLLQDAKTLRSSQKDAAAVPPVATPPAEFQA